MQCKAPFRLYRGAWRKAGAGHAPSHFPLAQEQTGSLRRPSGTLSPLSSLQLPWACEAQNFIGRAGVMLCMPRHWTCTITDIQQVAVDHCLAGAVGGAQGRCLRKASERDLGDWSADFASDRSDPVLALHLAVRLWTAPSRQLGQRIPVSLLVVTAIPMLPESKPEGPSKFPLNRALHSYGKGQQRSGKCYIVLVLRGIIS